MKKSGFAAIAGVLGVLGVGLVLWQRVQAGRRAQEEQQLIGRNVPSAPEFRRLLRRDLGLFFRQSTGLPVAVEPELLRREPVLTQVRYPRYYLWVRLLSHKKLLDEGVAVADAVSRTHFVVASYSSRSSLSRDPRSLDALVPEAVRPAVRAHLK